MSIAVWKDKLGSIIDPHSRAVHLIDARIDAERGEAALQAKASSWLDRHLEECAECARVMEARRRFVEMMHEIPRERAPDHFAARVLLRAKTRTPVIGSRVGKADPPADASRSRPIGSRVGKADQSPGRSQALAGFVLVSAVVAAIAVVVAVGPKASSEHGDVALRGGQGMEVAEKPHFVVRAPGLGPAKVRHEVTRVVESHGGTFQDKGGVIIARIPRSALVSFTQELANRAAFRMTKIDTGELGPEVDTILIEFALAF